MSRTNLAPIDLTSTIDTYLFFLIEPIAWFASFASVNAITAVRTSLNLATYVKNASLKPPFIHETIFALVTTKDTALITVLAVFDLTHSVFTGGLFEIEDEAVRTLSTDANVVDQHKSLLTV